MMRRGENKVAWWQNINFHELGGDKFWGWVVGWNGKNEKFCGKWADSYQQRGTMRYGNFEYCIYSSIHERIISSSIDERIINVYNMILKGSWK